VELGDLIESLEYKGESIDAKLYNRQIETGKATRMSQTDLAHYLDLKNIVWEVQEMDWEDFLT
jgi:hypothetical protein